MEEVVKILAHSLVNDLSPCLKKEIKIEEIRLRVEQPIFILSRGEEYYLTKDRKLVLSKNLVDGQARRIRRDELIETMNYISRYSRYAFEEEIRQGFFTIRGGHRIGFGGQVIVEQGQVRSFKQITFMNLRIAHEIKGCADCVIPYLYKDGRLQHTLIASGPGNGKTTMLRDLIRQISNNGLNVAIVDERNEIAACFQGIPQNEVGIRTDVLSSCPKTLGMKMLLRTMNPSVIAVDEIGTMNDLEAIYQVLGCGCTILATAHSTNSAFLHTILEKINCLNEYYY
ncbi:Stage III sporulation protein AA [Lachnospiraceae bacterium TWA4]|nr:Stage III sporulation protein AA [Lachnospiraceae bacterium TWA4]